MISLGLGLGIAGGGPSDPWAGLVTDGLVAEWRFAEGSGNAVADEIGSNDIDLTAPTTPNVTWVAQGVRTQSGMVQTPSITARTIVALVRVADNSAGGFVMSGGNGSGDGQYTDLWATTDTWHIGQHAGVAPVRSRSDNGLGGEIALSGGWRLMFRGMGASRTSVFGFGNRHTLENLAVNDMYVAWIGAYDDLLTDAERLSLYTTMRAVIASRGAYMDWRDCPTKTNGVLLFGTSNAEGRAEITGLTAGEQAMAFSKTYIRTSNFSTPGSATALLDLGVNQQIDDPANEFGPEIFLARSYEDAGHSRDLYICKAGIGSSYYSPSSDANVPVGKSWSDAETETTYCLWQGPLPGWWKMTASALDSGVGIDLKAMLHVPGENDALHDSTSLSFQTEFADVISAIRTYTGVTGLPVIAPRCQNVSGGNTTYENRVRAAIVAEADEWIDADAFSTFVGDPIHYDADGQRSLGQAFYTELNSLVTL